MVLMLSAFGFIHYVNAKKLLNYETQQMASIDHRHELFDEQWHRITSPMSHQETVTITSYREKKSEEVFISLLDSFLMASSIIH